MWGATLIASNGTKVRAISIHAPMWGATINELYYSIVSKFQSTHPCGVRLDKNEKLIKIVNFNPRTHVGCDPSFSKRVTMAGISIHAPMWGATNVTVTYSAFKGISIHAPMWGAPTTHLHLRRSVTYFNPRTHVGCDDTLSNC